MKKKILIVSHAMELGGVERSLLGLLGAIDPEKYQVDLFLLRHEGELLGQIPPYINLLPAIPAYTVLARPMVQTLREGHILLTAARAWGKWKAGRYVRRHGLGENGVGLDYSHKYTCPLLPKIQPDTIYDLAISFLTPHYFVARKVQAKQKIAWIHTDYAKVQVDIPSETAMWSAYDKIMSISQDVSRSFLQVFPSLESRLVLTENILPEALIRSQADAFSVDSEMPEGGFQHLLSIGRYCAAKNFDNIPAICSELLARGCPVKWYIIGFGGNENLIRQRIQEAHMENHVILLGKKENPYPYIKACDLYVQPSRYEGKCVAVREAQMLGKPVVITAYPTSSSQLTDGVDGVIVPMDNAGCAEGIARLLEAPAKMKQLSAACAQRDYTNSGEVEKLYVLIAD